MKKQCIVLNLHTAYSSHCHSLVRLKSITFNGYAFKSQFVPVKLYHLVYCTFFTSSCRKLEEAGKQNSDLLAIVANKEDTIHSNQLRLEEKNRECSTLSNKLQEALDDAHQQVCTQLLSTQSESPFPSKTLS